MDRHSLHGIEHDLPQAVFVDIAVLNEGKGTQKVGYCGPGAQIFPDIGLFP
jgi:hypothetical protein